MISQRCRREGSHRTKRSAFTLIELLVAITIVVILIALVLPSLGKAKYAALKVENMANMKQWSHGIGAHATDHRRRFPYNGWRDDGNEKDEIYPGRGKIGGQHISWNSSDVQWMWKSYMMPNLGAAKDGTKNVIYNPTQQWHRINDMNLWGGLCGYFYMPGRMNHSGVHWGINSLDPTNYNPGGLGYVERETLNALDPVTREPLYKYPVLSDMIQQDFADRWIHPTTGTPYSSWAIRGDGEAEGGHFLFEDGSVTWYVREEVDEGALQFGAWHFYYKLDL